MDQMQSDCKKLMDDLMVQLARKGYFAVGVIVYKEGATSDNEAVKVGCAVDFYSHPTMRPIVIRMLKAAAFILEDDPGKRSIETIELPER